ncbi:LysM peptidoglycan-binding domain-containing protein [Salinibacillus xinjiangensis]|uniref:LysM peptidoglycan-binding domain-containing protein n=1 Tax=Salinibacillus xinjiangensis TaxID=1229268 RepID=A0A6G1X4S5_9BACI|nr:LysM peptidoglycan-binding domain-containing protein [Salinibacillus xinjiangensis]MRG85880.1 LysM peptidoglycan-binding domain-containing protein [Salinibacillus xinjiangensis]
MEPFTHYKINETEDGIEVTLYLDENLTEFSKELGTVSKMEEEDVNKEAVSFVKRMFPSLKVKTVKIMAGAMLVSTLGLSAIPANQASAAEITQAASTSYTVTTGDTLYSIADRNGTSVDAIKRANQLWSNHIEIGQTLIIPSGNTAAPTTQTKGNTYKVASGDTLYSIATRNGTTVDAIKQANNLSSNFLKVGQTLSIPSGNTSAPTQTNETTYQVSSGDTLYSIAARHGTSVDAIKNTNNLSSNQIIVGQMLTIPSGNTAAPSTQTKTNTYTVASGETLYSIAARHGTSVDALKKANQLSSNQITVGQTLSIPTGVTSTPTPPPLKEQQSTVNQEDVEWLSKMIYSEGRGESLQGQIAIGAVIMNRVKSPEFPNNVKDVLFEKSYGYYQFTPAETGAIHNANPNAQNIEAAKRALNGEDPTNGALFFYNPDKTSSSYLRSRTVSTVIGNHTFAF